MQSQQSESRSKFGGQHRRVVLSTVYRHEKIETYKSYLSCIVCKPSFRNQMNVPLLTTDFRVACAGCKGCTKHLRNQASLFNPTSKRLASHPISRIPISPPLYLSTYFSRRFDCLHHDVSLNLDECFVHFGSTLRIASSTKFSSRRCQQLCGGTQVPPMKNPTLARGKNRHGVIHVCAPNNLRTPSHFLAAIKKRE